MKTRYHLYKTAIGGFFLVEYGEVYGIMIAYPHALTHWRSLRHLSDVLVYSFMAESQVQAEQIANVFIRMTS